jgi:hypothetical protein
MELTIIIYMDYFIEFIKCLTCALVMVAPFVILVYCAWKAIEAGFESLTIRRKKTYEE